MTTEALVLKAQAGECDALVKLVERYQAQVFSVCMAIMRNQADAADMTQETFVRLLRSLNTFHGCGFKSWLHRLTVNICLDGLRKQRRGPLSLDEAEIETESTDRWAEPVWRAEFDESAHEVHDALNQLPLQQRVALTLHYFESSSYEEIAGAMGLPLNTVKSHLLRGKQRLARLLAPAPFHEQRPIYRLTQARLSFVAA